MKKNIFFFFFFFFFFLPAKHVGTNKKKIILQGWEVGNGTLQMKGRKSDKKRRGPPSPPNLCNSPPPNFFGRSPYKAPYHSVSPSFSSFTFGGIWTPSPPPDSWRKEHAVNVETLIPTSTFCFMTLHTHKHTQTDLYIHIYIYFDISVSGVTEANILLVQHVLYFEVNCIILLVHYSDLYLLPLFPLPLPPVRYSVTLAHIVWCGVCPQPALLMPCAICGRSLCGYKLPLELGAPRIRLFKKQRFPCC